MPTKVLIANCGEIACRVIAPAKMGIFIFSFDDGKKIGHPLCNHENISL